MATGNVIVALVFALIGVLWLILEKKTQGKTIK